METLTRSAAPPSGIPPLENGDRLTRDEFERRYSAMPDVKAELIDGRVYMPSPVHHQNHGEPHFRVIVWLGFYAAATPVVEGGDNSSLQLDWHSEPQPDVLLRLKSGGGSCIGDSGMLQGPPEFVAEVASSSAAYDLHDKLRAYERNGVREYVVWRVRDEAIDWFVLREGRFERLLAGEDGIYRSEVFPGLWLDPAALLKGDLARVFQVVQQGLATPEHAAFLTRSTSA